ncbi:hypothetical protein TW81_02160 [Vibrio galatheae]|uniref:Uncharacterized protein n=1 Tax=Vibrio galatheae TaxID=579748 RepID=A0A0F4NPP6_9VIBR|nr:hypothetical protein [Vibrio galatheae]KJY84818.1 hypothetical protein TW81_02160 [Vibrio galatheae]
METIQERLINWGKWASNATGTGYRGQLAQYKNDFNLDGDSIEDALLIDRAVASTAQVDSNYPYILYQYFANKKSVKTICVDWHGAYKAATRAGWSGGPPPGETKLRQIIDIAAHGCVFYLQGLQDAA